MDDLKKIKGVGAATERKLRAAGLDSFAKVAAATPDQLKAVQIAGGQAEWAGFIAEAAKLVSPHTTAATNYQEGGGNSAVTPAVAAHSSAAEPVSLNPADTEALAALDLLADKFGVPRDSILIAADAYLSAPSFVQPDIAPLDLPEGVIVLAVDAEVSADQLCAVTVTGPAKGRWRVGHHFTDQAQHLLVSVGTFARLKDDETLTVTKTD